jgi:osmotically-inducible protein OsmY
MAALTPDAAIERSLKARLSRSKLKQDGLSFAVKNGVVEWQGEVGVPQRKGAATRMAKAAGAAKVINRIRINPNAVGAGTAAAIRNGSSLATQPRGNGAAGDASTAAATASAVQRPGGVARKPRVVVVTKAPRS